MAADEGGKKPPAAVNPMLAGIFANAQATTLRHPEVKDGVATVRCPSCGAARPDGSDLRACQFCGKDLFPEEPPE